MPSRRIAAKRRSGSAVSARSASRSETPAATAASVTWRARSGSSIPIRFANCATEVCAGPSSGGRCARSAAGTFACQSVLGSST
ncbi:MAG: hypothetical protein E6J87_19605 [Deltaproteobacteria bacterium]|nr:MAG: hypothetical protein E6J87_19605 [Deltaproteobacteria bacterium]